MKYIAIADKIFTKEEKKPDVIETYNETDFSRVIRCKVISVGNDVEIICAGDIIYFGINNSKQIVLEEDDYYVIQEKMVILKEENE